MPGKGKKKGGEGANNNSNSNNNKGKNVATAFGNSKNGADAGAKGKKGRRANKKPAPAKEPAKEPIVEEVDSAVSSSSEEGGDLVIPGDVARMLAKQVQEEGGSDSSGDDQAVLGYGAGAWFDDAGSSDTSDFSDDSEDDEIVGFYNLQVAGGKERVPLSHQENVEVNLTSCALTGGKKGQPIELWVDMWDMDKALGMGESDDEDEELGSDEAPRKQILLCILETGRTDQCMLNLPALLTDDDVHFYHTGPKTAIIHLVGDEKIDLGVDELLYGSDSDSGDSAELEFGEDPDDVPTEELVERIRELAQKRRDGEPVEFSSDSEDDSDEESSPDDEARVKSVSSDAEMEEPAAPKKKQVVTAFGTAGGDNKNDKKKAAKKRPAKGQAGKEPSAKRARKGGKKN